MMVIWNQILSWQTFEKTRVTKKLFNDNNHRYTRETKCKAQLNIQNLLLKALEETLTLSDFSYTLSGSFPWMLTAP